MEVPRLILDLQGAPGFWPAGWELERAGPCLGVRCGGRWVVAARIRPWMLEVDVVDGLQRVLDGCIESLPEHISAAAQGIGATIIREAREFETSAGRRIPLQGFRRVVMSEAGVIVEGPTASAGAVEAAVAKLLSERGGPLPRWALGTDGRERSATTPRG